MAIILTAAATMAFTIVVMVVWRSLGAREKKIKHVIEAGYSVRDEQFSRAVGSLLPPAMLPGNQVTALHNGDQIFPAMLRAIREARRTICFETFIYWSGEIGKAFADALTERARSGVKVHILLDWLGSKRISEQELAGLRQAGGQIVRYHPMRWYNPWRINERTHRKLLIVDGVLGFTGGVGIADEWQGDATDPEHWRDSHYRLEGPCVAQLQSAFMDNWTKTNSRVLHDEEYFPALEPAGELTGQLFMSSPEQGAESMPMMYLLSFAAARDSIRLTSAYFVPDDLFIDGLVAASRRGVRVEVIIPGPNVDMAVARRAGRARWGKLLEADVHIYEYQPCRFHCKLLIVDNLWVSVGSTNCDNRSLRLNDEANLNVLDENFARQQAEVFEQDKRRARLITLKEWQERPWSEKLKERAAAMLRSQL